MSIINNETTQSGTTSKVTGSTLIVMGGMAAAIVVGLLRQRIVAGQFGTGAELDAYTAANGIPELLFTMLAGGALAFAFIPLYTEKIKSEDGSANLLLSQVLNTIFLITALAAFIVAVAAPTLVSARWGVGPHFPPRVQLLTAQLMRILLVSTVIFAISSIITGALHAHQHFLLPAITPVMYSGGIIFGALVLSPTTGIFGLAWGAVIGSILHLLVQIPGLIRYKISWQLAFGWREPTLQKVAILMAPRVVDLMMARIMIDWINSNIGSGLGEGRVSALRYSFQLMNMPWTFIGTAIGIAVFPTMAVLAAQKDVSAQRDTLSNSLRAILTLAIPAAIGLIVLGRPIIRVLYEGGEFTAQSTELVFYALQFYALTLLSQSVLEVVIRAFAAQQDTLTPLLVSLFTTTINVTLAFWLTRPISAGGFEHGGLALANGIAVGLESLAGLTILHFRWKGINAKRILVDAGKALIAGILMGGLIIAIKSSLDLSSFMTLIIGGSLGIVVYFGVALVLGIEEVRSIPLSIVRRISA